MPSPSQKIMKALAILRHEGRTALLEKIDTTLAWRQFNRRLELETPRNRAFDERHGTDTADEVDLTSAGLDASAARRGNQVYRVFWEESFERVLADLPIEHSRYTFVDIGSGKGKLLLLAAHRPFRRVLGIELAPALHQIAARNIAIYHPPERRCTDVISVLADALTFEIPEGPLVCLMVNPFDTDTMRQVVARLGDAASRSSSPVFVVYANMRRIAEAGTIFDGVPGLAVLRRRRNHIVLGNTAAACRRQQPEAAGNVGRPMAEST